MQLHESVIRINLAICIGEYCSNMTFDGRKLTDVTRARIILIQSLSSAEQRITSHSYHCYPKCHLNLGSAKQYNVRCRQFLIPCKFPMLIASRYIEHNATVAFLGNGSACNLFSERQATLNNCLPQLLGQ